MAFVRMTRPSWHREDQHQQGSRAQARHSPFQALQVRTDGGDQRQLPHEQVLLGGKSLTESCEYLLRAHFDCSLPLQSGKLVSNVFGKIRELVEERNSFVVVLIDEGTGLG
jgi:hypothetical protein